MATDERALRPGAFYWVIPAYDVDFTPPGFEGREYGEAMHAAMRDHWSNNPQPARFVGYHEGNPDWPRWLYLGQEDDDWDARWVGGEIVAPEF